MTACDKFVVFISAMMILCNSCAIEDEDRCGDEYVYKDNNCVESVAEKSETDAGEVDASNRTGMGKFCRSDSDCVEYDADYCALDPATGEGGCTIRGCRTQPDDCPAGWNCCDFPEGFAYPDMCIVKEEYDKISETMCQG